MTVYTSQQAHDDITTLFNAYYDAKKADVQADSIPPNKRIESADAIVEQYIEINGKRPPASVLSRLGTYLLLDDLSDPHPDKMSRGEYPIMSEYQLDKRRRGEVYVSRNPYSSYIHKDKYNRLDVGYFLSVLDGCKLSKRQEQSVIKHFLLGYSQTDIAKRLNIGRSNVHQYLRTGIYKIRDKKGDILRAS